MDDTPGLFGPGDVAILGGNFSVRNTVHQHGTGALQTILQNSATDAMAYSAERHPRPQCAEGTREAILAEITTWIRNPQSDKRILWLHGSVGMGKSAIMQTIADADGEAERAITGTFFFGRTKGRREHGTYLFPTLAYQLATRIPQTQAHIVHTVSADPSLFHLDLPRQFRALIANPLRAAQSASSTPIYALFLIDGLDECKGIEIQESILQICAEFILHHPSLRIIFASRREAHIQDVFDTPSISETVHRVDMLSMEAQNPDGLWPDVRKVLHDGFKRIYETRLKKFGVPSPWPSAKVEDELVELSSGQMVFVDTILKVVGDRYSNPQDQLETVLDMRTRSTTMTPLDTLYRQILSVFPDPKKPTDLLELIMLPIRKRNGQLPPSIVRDLLGWRPGEVETVAAGLASVIDMTDDDIRITHASFSEFLRVYDRSGPYFVDPTLVAFYFIIKKMHRGTEQIILDLQLADKESNPPPYMIQPNVMEYLILEGIGMAMQMWCNRIGETELEPLFSEALLKDARRFEEVANIVNLSTERLSDPSHLASVSLRSLDFILTFLTPRHPYEAQYLAQRLSPLAEPYRRVYYRYLDAYWRTPGSLGDLLRLAPSFPLFSRDAVPFGVPRTYPASTQASMMCVPGEVFQEAIETNKQFLDSSVEIPSLSLNVVDYYVRSGRVEEAPCCLDGMLFNMRLEIIKLSVEELRRAYINVGGSRFAGIDPEVTDLFAILVIDAPLFVEYITGQLPVDIERAISEAKGHYRHKGRSIYSNNIDNCLPWFSHLQQYLLALCDIDYPPLIITLSVVDYKDQEHPLGAKAWRGRIVVGAAVELSLKLLLRSEYDTELEDDVWPEKRQQSLQLLGTLLKHLFLPVEVVPPDPEDAQEDGETFPIPSHQTLRPSDPTALLLSNELISTGLPYFKDAATKMFFTPGVEALERFRAGKLDASTAAYTFLACIIQDLPLRRPGRLNTELCPELVVQLREVFPGGVEFESVEFFKEKVDAFFKGGRKGPESTTPVEVPSPDRVTSPAPSSEGSTRNAERGGDLGGSLGKKQLSVLRSLFSSMKVKRPR